MKIGVYGGSFNPCHLMHKKLVNELLEKNVFDRIIIIPTGNFYKKSNLLKGEYRINLLELMFQNNDRVIISDYEFKNNLICTYRTMDYLQNMYKGDTLYFILGSDNLKSFNTWKRYEYILNTYNLLVINRKNLDITDELKQYSKYKGNIEFMDFDLDDISSSDIRDLLFSNNPSAKDYLDPQVYEYILKKGYYQENFVEEINNDLSDEEFLKQYNPDSYERMSITTDITLFGVSDKKKNNYRSIDQKCFSVLLVKRNTPPFNGKWNLPGGFLSLDETLIDCAKRVLFTETNLDSIYLEQLYTFSDVDRDIRGRVLSASYLGLVDKNIIEGKLKKNAAFFNIKMHENNNIITINFESDNDKFECLVERIYDKFGVESFKAIRNDYLAFDNLNVIACSIKRLQSKINYTDLVFHMMPEKFTLKELQLVYEAILDKKLLDPVFRRNMNSLVEKTDEYKIDGGHRPAALYKRRIN